MAVAVLAVSTVAVWVSCPVLPVAAAKPLALLGEPLQGGADRMPVPPLSWSVAAGLAAQDRAEPASCRWGERASRTLTVWSCWAVLRGVVGVALPAMPPSPLWRGTRRPAGHRTSRRTGRIRRRTKCGTRRVLGRGTGRRGRTAGLVAVGRRVPGPRPVRGGFAAGRGVGVPLSRPTTPLCALGGLWQAVDAPVGVQLDRRHNPHRPLFTLLGHGAKLGHQPPRRVQHHRARIHAVLPGQLAGDELLAAAQLGVVRFQPAGALLLVAAQHPPPLGGLVRLPGQRPRPMLGQRQPVAGGQPSRTATRVGRLGAGGLDVGQGLPAGLLQLGRTPLG